MGKSPRSFSIDDDLDELLSNRNDINASAVVNSFLREYVAGGRGKEAALETRVQQLDEEIAELEKDLERKRRERDRLEQQLSNERQTTHEAVAEMVDLIQAGNFDRENLTVENEAVVLRASEAGIPTERFIEEVEARL
jgi:predicted RNase H-like nuclease (RuvC/YqgF family)